MNSPLRVVYPVSLDVKATELNKVAHRYESALRPEGLDLNHQISKCCRSKAGLVCALSTCSTRK